MTRDNHTTHDSNCNPVSTSLPVSQSRLKKIGSSPAHVKLPPLPKPSSWGRVSSFNRYARDLELNPDAQSTRYSFHAIEKKEQAEGYGDE